MCGGYSYSGNSHLIVARPWTTKDKNKLYNLYTIKNADIHFIASKMSRSEKAIRRAVERFGYYR